MATVTTSGIWTSVSKALPQMQGLNTNHLSWGVPYQYRQDVNPGKKQSGYEFYGVSAAPVLFDGTEFKLGTFTHNNFGLNPPAVKFTANLTVTLAFDTGALTRQFNFTFDHNETDGWGVPDEVGLPSMQSAETVAVDGTEYALSITGFRQDGKEVSKFLSAEDRSNSADIFARMVAVPAEVTQPAPTEPRIAVCETTKPIEPVTLTSTQELQPAASAPPPVPEAQCRVKRVEGTSTLFAAAIERLNRRSVVHLMEQVITEVNEHCEQLTAKVTASGQGGGGDLGALRAELLALISGLRQTTDGYVSEVNSLTQQISSLQVNLPQMVQQIVQQTIQSVDISAVLQQIEMLNVKLDLIQKSAQELDQGELGQVDALLQKLLQNTDLSTVVQNIRVSIDGRSFDLRRLVEVLSTADQVVSLQIQYADDDDMGDITGARFVLTDQTQVHFRVRMLQQSDSRQVKYVFETGNWKGLAAQFGLVFNRRVRNYKLCMRSVNLELFDGVEQTNIVFDLCTQLS